MKKLNIKQSKELIEILKQTYPDATCSLDFTTPFEMVVSVMLSAQCTDARVNIVTPALFEKYKTLDDYCNADVKDIERLIHSCGFYKSKAESIIGMATKIRDEFDGAVPDNIDDLIAFCVEHMSNENWSAEQVRGYMADMLPKLNHWKTQEKIK